MLMMMTTDDDDGCGGGGGGDNNGDDDASVNVSDGINDDTMATTKIPTTDLPHNMSVVKDTRD